MACEVEYTDEFEQWWNELSEPEQDSVAVFVGLLEQKGAQLTVPVQLRHPGLKVLAHARTEDSAQGKAVQDSLCFRSPAHCDLVDRW